MNLIKTLADRTAGFFSKKETDAVEIKGGKPTSKAWERLVRIFNSRMANNAHTDPEILMQTQLRRAMIVGGLTAMGALTATQAAVAAPYVENGAFARGLGPGTSGFTSSFDVPITVSSRTALAALSTNFAVAYLTEAGREGTWRWNSANLASAVTADPQQGLFVPPTAGSGSAGAWQRVLDNYYTATPMWFGAKFDTSTNDTDAWNGLISCINAGFVKIALLPGGITTVLQTLDTITQTGWAIVGAQYRATQMRMGNSYSGATAGTFFTLGTTANAASMCRISGIYFNNTNSVNLTGTNGQQINLFNTLHCYIDECYFANGNGGIKIGDSAANTSAGSSVATCGVTNISFCYFLPDTTLGGTAMDIQSWANLKVTNTMAGASGVAAAAYNSIWIHPKANDTADSSFWVDCQFNSASANWANVMTIDGTLNSIGTQKFLSCVFDQVVNGSAVLIQIRAGNNDAAYIGAAFTNCTSNASTGGICLEIQNSSTSSPTARLHVLVEGGSYTSLNNPCIKFTGTNPVQTIVSGCTFNNRTTAAAGLVGAAILVNSQVSGIQLLGNQVAIRTDGLGSLMTPYDYFVEINGNASNILIKDNDASLCPSGLIKDGTGVSNSNGPTILISGNATASNTANLLERSTTSDATPTIIDQITISANGAAYKIAAKVMADRANAASRAYYEFIGFFYRAGGTVSQQGATVSVASLESNAGLDASFVISGNTVQVQVTGLAGNDVRWWSSYDIQKVAA